MEAIKNNITFELKINGKFSMNYMIEEFLSASKIATLLSDHIKNAIIAINSSNNTYKSICVIIGEINNTYGILIYDSGVEFDKNILLNIGNEPVTSHADTGGTGYGFMTTVETLEEINASLVIDELKPCEDNYTKSVGIIFDNKSEYRIKSYRKAELRKMNHQGRIKI